MDADRHTSAEKTMDSKELAPHSNSSKKQDPSSTSEPPTSPNELMHDFASFWVVSQRKEPRSSPEYAKFIEHFENITKSTNDTSGAGKDEVAVGVSTVQKWKGSPRRLNNSIRENFHRHHTDGPKLAAELDIRDRQIQVLKTTTLELIKECEGLRDEIFVIQRQIRPYIKVMINRNMYPIHACTVPEQVLASARGTLRSYHEQMTIEDAYCLRSKAQGYPSKWPGPEKRNAACEDCTKQKHVCLLTDGRGVVILPLTACLRVGENISSPAYWSLPLHDNTVRLPPDSFWELRSARDNAIELGFGPPLSRLRKETQNPSAST